MDTKHVKTKTPPDTIHTVQPFLYSCHFINDTICPVTQTKNPCMSLGCFLSAMSYIHPEHSFYNTKPTSLHLLYWYPSSTYLQLPNGPPKFIVFFCFFSHCFHDPLMPILHVSVRVSFKKHQSDHISPVGNLWCLPTSLKIIKCINAYNTQYDWFLVCLISYLLPFVISSQATLAFFL